jgi:hypothetical protein
MCFGHNRKVYAALLAFTLLTILSGASSLQAQTKQILQWSTDLNYLKNASADELAVNKAEDASGLGD